MINTFFESLAVRRNRENDLSDVTFAMCLASRTFQELFLNFFFPNKSFKIVNKFEREKSEGDSRPDFYIENDTEKFLIEVKIYDRNQHFEQYLQAFELPKENLGYITNYSLYKKDHQIKSWEELYDCLRATTLNDEEEQKLWAGYLKYLENVCSISKITTKMDLKGMHSLYNFSLALRKVVNRVENDYQSQFYSDNTIQKGPGIKGCFFELNYKDGLINPAWGSLGVYYSSPEPFFCLGFENRDGWGKSVYEILSPNAAKITETDICSAPYFEDNAIWFEMTNKTLASFQNSDVDMQIELLRQFMDEVVLKPINLLK